MQQVGRGLGTRLDWVAVNHWDTDNPHTHIVLRGKDDRGADLVIARDYIGRGMRARASELATRWLGPRTKREIERSRKRETVQDRWTGLDRALSMASRDGVVDLHRVPGDLGRRRHRALLLGRLRSEEHTSELQSLMRISYAVFCLTKKTKTQHTNKTPILSSILSINTT